MKTYVVVCIALFVFSAISHATKLELLEKEQAIRQPTKGALAFELLAHLGLIAWGIVVALAI